jgi:hypothetical protein
MPKTFTIVAVETVEMQPITEFVTVKELATPLSTRCAAMKKFFRGRSARETTAIIDIFEGEQKSINSFALAVYYETLKAI